MPASRRQEDQVGQVVAFNTLLEMLQNMIVDRNLDADYMTFNTLLEMQ